MIQVHKIKKGVYSFESEEHLTKVLFSENKVWMNKKELSKLFGRKKSDINSMISRIFVEGEFDISDHIIQSYNSTLEKEVKYYNLDIILSLGYRFGSFEETRFIIAGNRIIKEYKNNKNGNLLAFQTSIRTFSRMIKSLQLG